MLRNPDVLRDRRFDVIVVGGGMHGAWIALRAARAGQSVALLERGDFGAGTSANSLKILHGGLRYLQGLDLARMRRSIESRREFARASPRLFEPLPCLMPLSATGLRSPWALGPALLANELVSADRNAGVVASARLPTAALWSASRTRAALAPLGEHECSGGALWWDAVVRDAGRLVVDVLQLAADSGAVVLNHIAVERILVAAGKVEGVVARGDGAEGGVEVRTRWVVNATGPWAPQLARASGLVWPEAAPSFVGGLNLLLRRSLGPQVALALGSREASNGGTRRDFFFVPWQGVTMVGTDYCAVAPAAPPAVFAPSDAIAAFLQRAARLAPRARLEREDVALVHWGLLPASSRSPLEPAGRPFIAAHRDEAGADGLVHVVAEKLTSAPVLSRQVMARLGLRGGTRRADSDGAAPAGVDPKFSGTVPPQVLARLQARYGFLAPRVAAFAAATGGAYDPLHEGSPVLALEARWAIQHEQAATLADMLRRLGLGGHGEPPADTLDACTRIAARDLGWDDARRSVERRTVEDWYRRNRTGVP